MEIYAKLPQLLFSDYDILCYAAFRYEKGCSNSFEILFFLSIVIDTSFLYHLLVPIISVVCSF